MHGSFDVELSKAFQHGTSIRDLAQQKGIPQARIRAILTLIVCATPP